jgi:YD repeat-containing protein
MSLDNSNKDRSDFVAQPPEALNVAVRDALDELDRAHLAAGMRQPRDAEAQRRREDDFFKNFARLLDDNKDLKRRDDGTSYRDRADGSRLDYGADGKLSKVTYGDGKFREFKWDGDRLIATRTQDGKWFDRVDTAGQEGWRDRTTGGVWNGKVRVDEKTGTYSIDSSNAGNGMKLTMTTDGVKKIDYADGRREISYGGKGMESYDRQGQLEKLVAEDGTVRTFGRARDGELSSVRVQKPDGKVYDWQQRAGKWYCNGEASDNTFSVDSNKGTYTWTDGKAGETHTLDARGNETIAGKERTLHLHNGQLSKVTTADGERSFERNGKGEIIAIRDRDSELRQQADGTWQRFGADGKPADDGFPRKGIARVNADTGEVSFLTKDNSVVKQDVGGAPVELKAPPELAKLIGKSGLDAEARMRMIENAHHFINRSELSEDEKKRTVEQVCRLLDSKGSEPFKKADCEKLADQLMWHVAHPELDSQGNHPTCNVSDIRICLERENPSAFAKLIADTVTTGGYETASGKRIVAPYNESLLPGKEEQKWPPEDATRTWVGKISDVMMANIHWRRRDTDLNGNKVTPGSLYYDEVRPTGQSDSSSRIYRYEKQGDSYYRYELAQSPSLYASGIMDIYKQITGKDETGRMIVHSSRPSGNGTAVIDTVADLRKQLERGPYPKIVQLQNNILVGEKPDGKDHEHVVVVTGYDPKTGKVAIDNSHGRQYDMLTPDKQISVEQLHKAMKAPPVVYQAAPIRLYYTYNGYVYSN